MSVSPEPSSQAVVVSGSISNLGPGFDALAVAIQLFLRVEIVAIRPEARGILDCRFPEGLPDGENRILSAFLSARALLGVEPPGLTVAVTSEIPVRAGLGSSGAATIAGLLLYERLTGLRPPEGWLRLATDLEGHPDNAAAALAGGLAISCQHPDGRVTSRTAAWSPEVRLVVATPRAEVATTAARQRLPASVPLRDAVFNLQHALLLVEALRAGDTAGVRDALHDRWHQDARAALVPGLREALALRHPALLGVSLCGSGPSIVAWTTAVGESETIDLFRDLYAGLDVTCAVRPVLVQPPAATAATMPL